MESYNSSVNLWDILNPLCRFQFIFCKIRFILCAVFNSIWSD
jgi:hypothetical protein